MFNNAHTTLLRIVKKPRNNCTLKTMSKLDVCCSWPECSGWFKKSL